MVDEPDDGAAPNFDEQVKKMIARAKKRGAVTFEEINKVLPQDQHSSEQIDVITSQLSEMGVNVVESDYSDDDDDDAEPKKEADADDDTGMVVDESETGINLKVAPPLLAPLEGSNDLILDGTIVRIALIRRPNNFMLWSKAALASRLYNRLARETAFEVQIGFLADADVNHLNFEAEPFRPFAADATTVKRELTDETMFVITESSYWWAELKLKNEFDPERLKFTKTTYELPGGTTYALMCPLYDGYPLNFKCPPQPQHPEIRTDVTRLLESDWRELKQLDPCTKELEPIMSDPLGPTATFRRALKALIAELAAHGILAEDDHLNHFSGCQSVADIEPTVDFYALNSLSPDADIPCLQLDSITECFDHSFTQDTTEVEWNDNYEYLCRVGSPEMDVSVDIISSMIHYVAATDEAMREAIFTCQRIAPRFGLCVDFDGDVSCAATVFLAEGATARI